MKQGLVDVLISLNFYIVIKDDKSSKSSLEPEPEPEPEPETSQSTASDEGSPSNEVCVITWLFLKALVIQLGQESISCLKYQ